MNNIVKQEDALPVVSESPSLGNMMQMLAASNLDAEQMKVMQDMFYKHEDREARKAFERAIMEFKKNPPKIVKDLIVDFTNQKGHRTYYKHAGLAQVNEKINAALSQHGLATRWRTKIDGSNVHVTCVLSHEMGHQEETSLFASPDTSGGKNGIQAIGSTTTYLQRYTLLAAVGLAPDIEDNDANTNPDRVSAIDEKQLADLEKMIKETASDEVALCKFANVSELSELTKESYRQVMDLLRKKKAKQ